MNEQLQRAIDVFKPWKELHCRMAWKPIVSESPECSSISKFGGIPLLKAGETWPVCSGCKQPMQLFLQLDLSSVPSASPAYRQQGILQFYFCTSYEDCGNYEPFGEGMLVRVLEPNLVASTETVVPENLDVFEASHIVDWELFDDYPSGTERTELGLEIEYPEGFDENGQTVTNLQWKEKEIVVKGLKEKVWNEETKEWEYSLEKIFGKAATNDKLSGWPYWVQNVEYPVCPKCQSKMTYLFQIDSEDNVPFMFGDVGCGHISQCPNHPEIVTFDWACC
jgi:uncharacterized protein YwqG